MTGSFEEGAVDSALVRLRLDYAFSLSLSIGVAFFCSREKSIYNGD